MKLLEQCRQTARVKHLAFSTEKTYVYWIERYLRFHGIRHPNTLGAPDVETFLSHLAVAGLGSVTTQSDVNS